MHIGLVITVLAYLTACAVVYYWCTAAFRMVRTWWLVPTLRAGLTRKVSHADAQASVCIVVPAHNEGGLHGPIAGLIRSALAQDYPNFTLVLALDRCTDDTEAVAREAIKGDSRARIVIVDHCPPDWASKVHAVHEGVRQSPEASRADLLLFVDADTMFEPGCLRAAVALLDDKKVGLLSVLSNLTHDRWFECIAQPVAALELARQYPLVRANRKAGAKRGRRAFANGQFMLFRRDFYERIGGHEGVKGQLLEDLALARKAQDPDSANGDIGLVLADGLFKCRMYDSGASFREGWKRIYIEAAKRKKRRVHQAAIIVRLFGSVLPGLCVGLLPVAIWTPAWMGSDYLAAWPFVLALAIFLGALQIAHAMSRTPGWTALFHIIGAWQVANILDRARKTLRRREPIRWGGREYVLQPR